MSEITRRGLIGTTALGALAVPSKAARGEPPQRSARDRKEAGGASGC